MLLPSTHHFLHLIGGYFGEVLLHKSVAGESYQVGHGTTALQIVPELRKNFAICLISTIFGIAYHAVKIKQNGSDLLNIFYIFQNYLI